MSWDIAHSTDLQLLHLLLALLHCQPPFLQSLLHLSRMTVALVQCLGKPGLVGHFFGCLLLKPLQLLLQLGYLIIPLNQKPTRILQDKSNEGNKIRDCKWTKINVST